MRDPEPAQQPRPGTLVGVRAGRLARRPAAGTARSVSCPVPMPASLRLWVQGARTASPVAPLTTLRPSAFQVSNPATRVGLMPSRAACSSIRSVVVEAVGVELRGRVEHRPPLRIGGERLQLLTDLVVQGGDLGGPRGVGSFSLHLAEVSAPAPLALAGATAARCAAGAGHLDPLVPEPTPVREGLRNRCPATHSPGPSGEELCSGAGSDGGGRPDQDCFRSEAPEGRMDLGPVGRRRRGRRLR